MNRNLKSLFFLPFFILSIFVVNFSAQAQPKEQLEFSLDVNSRAYPLPKIYRPNMDLSGRGFHRDPAWPQSLAAREVLGLWQKDIGYQGFYRVQYNLWEIAQLDKDKKAQGVLLSNYESVIKSVNDQGGVVILDLFGTPAGLGRVLDKNSPPQNLKLFKQLVKNTIRNLSCEKKYNIWYEVWNAPDIDDFFLGKRAEYFNLYRCVAEAVKELKRETKIHIRLGGPGSSCWFQNLDANTIFTPEKSLIYELIKYCYSYKLPLDFISWHAYSSDPGLEENQNTVYGNSVVGLIRDWAEYFHFDRATPLIIDEWNFDRNVNLTQDRADKSYITASFIPSRLKSMSAAGLDNQIYFALEDFQIDKEGINRNLGVFAFDAERTAYKGSAKASYNVFRMLAGLEDYLLDAKIEDEFIGIIPTKSKDALALLVYNYIDPDIAVNYISRNIVNLGASPRKVLLNIIKSDRFEKILSKSLDLSTLRLDDSVRGILSKAVELDTLAKKFISTDRKLKLSFKGLKEVYAYSRYMVSGSCAFDCDFSPVEEKELDFDQPQPLDLDLTPYSVQLLVFKKKPAAALAPAPSSATTTAAETARNAEGK